MKKQLIILLSFFFSTFFSWQVEAQAQIKIACVGNSITEGAGLKQPYPEALQELLGSAYEVRNYGISGRTLLKDGDFPYWQETKYLNALAWNPDIVIIKLGTNDSKPQNWKHKKKFVKDYVALVKSFQKMPSKPLVYICYPMPVFEDKFNINGEVVEDEILPAIHKVSLKTKVKTIDLFSPFMGKAELTYDGIHPNDAGADLLAKEVFKALSKSLPKK